MGCGQSHDLAKRKSVNADGSKGEGQLPEEFPPKDQLLQTFEDRKAFWLGVRVQKFPLNFSKIELAKAEQLFTKYAGPDRNELTEEDCLRGTVVWLELQKCTPDLRIMNQMAFKHALTLKIIPKTQQRHSPEGPQESGSLNDHLPGEELSRPEEQRAALSEGAEGAAADTGVEPKLDAIETLKQNDKNEKDDMQKPCEGLWGDDVPEAQSANIERATAAVPTEGSLPSQSLSTEPLEAADAIAVPTVQSEPSAVPAAPKPDTLELEQFNGYLSGLRLAMDIAMMFEEQVKVHRASEEIEPPREPTPPAGPTEKEIETEKLHAIRRQSIIIEDKKLSHEQEVAALKKQIEKDKNRGSVSLDSDKTRRMTARLIEIQQRNEEIVVELKAVQQDIKSCSEKNAKAELQKKEDLKKESKALAEEQTKIEKDMKVEQKELQVLAKEEIKFKESRLKALNEELKHDEVVLENGKKLEGEQERLIETIPPTPPPPPPPPEEVGDCSMTLLDCKDRVVPDLRDTYGISELVLASMVDDLDKETKPHGGNGEVIVSPQMAAECALCANCKIEAVRLAHYRNALEDALRDEELEAAVARGNEAERRSADTRKRVWEKTVKQRLPRSRNSKEHRRRSQLFIAFDTESKRTLTYDEFAQGCKEHLGLEEFFKPIDPILVRAFEQAASTRAPNQAPRKQGEELLMRRIQFRIALVFIYDYLELFVALEELGMSPLRRVRLLTFKRLVPLFLSWGVAISDPEAVFSEIDEFDVGSVPFDDLADWAIYKHMEAQKVTAFRRKQRVENFGDQEENPRHEAVFMDGYESDDPYSRAQTAFDDRRELLPADIMCSAPADAPLTAAPQNADDVKESDIHVKTTPRLSSVAQNAAAVPAAAEHAVNADAAT